MVLDENQQSKLSEAREIVKRNTPDPSDDPTDGHRNYSDVRSTATAMVDIAIASEKFQDLSAKELSAPAIYAANLLCMLKPTQDEVAADVGTTKSVVAQEYENMIQLMAPDRYDIKNAKTTDRE